MKQRGDVRSVFLVFSVLALGACGDPPLPDEASITGLQFTSYSEMPENRQFFVVDVTLTDPGPTRAIYGATVALPDFPPGEYSCPADFGIRDRISFASGQAEVVTATLNPFGCGNATISGSSHVRQTSEAYWNLVAQNLGINVMSLTSLPPR